MRKSTKWLGSLAWLLVLLIGVFWVWTSKQQEQLSTLQILPPQDIRLITHKGENWGLQNMQEKPTVLFFGFTHCPDVCPSTLFELSEDIKKDPKANLQVLFASVDPTRDTPELLNGYLQAFDPRIVGLTGEENEVEKLVRTYRIYAKKIPLDGGGYTMDHTATLFLLDKKGRLFSTISPQEKPDTRKLKINRLLQLAQ